MRGNDNRLIWAVIDNRLVWTDGGRDHKKWVSEYTRLTVQEWEHGVLRGHIRHNIAGGTVEIVSYMGDGFRQAKPDGYILEQLVRLAHEEYGRIRSIRLYAGMKPWTKGGIWEPELMYRMIEMEVRTMPNVKSCRTCRWAGCRHYGKNADACSNYIMSLEEEKRLEELENERPVQSEGNQRGA